MRLSKFKSSFLYHAIVHYNDLPADIKNCQSISIFKRKLKKFINTLTAIPYESVSIFPMPTQVIPQCGR